jgi:hypothetical protein
MAQVGVGAEQRLLKKDMEKNITYIPSTKIHSEIVRCGSFIGPPGVPRLAGAAEA